MLDLCQMQPRLLIAAISLIVITIGCARHPSNVPSDIGKANNANLIQVTDQTFAQEVLEPPIPVVVVMGTRWCPQCIELKSSLQLPMFEYDGKVLFREVDVETNRFLAEKYEIDQYPTLLIFADGRKVERIVGLPEITALEELLSTIAVPQAEH